MHKGNKNIKVDIIIIFLLSLWIAVSWLPVFFFSPSDDYRNMLAPLMFIFSLAAFLYGTFKMIKERQILKNIFYYLPLVLILIFFGVLYYLGHKPAP